MNSSLENPIIKPPDGVMRIGTTDMHTGGEPLRVITGGLPAIPGENVLQKRSYFREHWDQLRTGLMFEPRGHADMYGAIFSEAQDDADFDVFFLHNEGYSTMCGHAIIALTKLVIEAGLVGGPNVSFNVPAGRINASATLEGRTVSRTSFRNVPSFVLLRDKVLDIPGIGRVSFDVAYGGAFYVIVAADAVGIGLIPECHYQLIQIGRQIKQAVADNFPITHPFEPELSFLYGTIFTGPPNDKSHHSRNVCIFADGEVDRSATGSGVSARAALHHVRGDLPQNHPITIESILGTTMTATVVERVRFGPYEAIVPEVSGSAYFCGRQEFWFDPQDPLVHGFLLR
jgi:proline racemase